MSLTITLDGTTSDLQAFYTPPIILEGRNWEIGLIDFHTYNSIPNIDETNNAIVIGDHVLQVPTGTYEIEELGQYINSELRALKNAPEETNFVKIRGNNSTMKCEIESELEIDLSLDRSLAPILGFEPRVLHPGKIHISNRPVDIVKVNDIRIECNIASGSFVNNRPSHFIYGFYPDVPPGYKMIQRPSTVIYHPIVTNIISYLRIRVLDQNHQLINFRNELITIRLHLRQQ